MVYFFYLCLGRQRANNFRGKQLSCAVAAPWADFVCVLCFCQLHMCPVRGSGGVALPLFIMLHVYFMCVCAEEGKAAFAAICSAVTKIFCPKTLSSVNIYGAIAVQPLPLPLSTPSLCVVFRCVDTRQRKLSTEFVPRAAWHAATIDSNNKSNKRKII